jgi:hypothetical protein
VTSGTTEPRALSEQTARLEELRAERAEIVDYIDEARRAIMWLQAELKGLAGASAGHAPAGPALLKSGAGADGRTHAVSRAAWGAAGVASLVTLLWVLL